MAALLQQIRAAIAERLRGHTDAGARVFTNRSTDLWDNSLPAILVYTKTERVERETTATLKRVATVVVEVVVTAAEGEPLDDRADEVAEQVEARLWLDPELRAELGQLVNDARPVAYDLIVEAGGDELVAGARLTWEFTYYQDLVLGDPAALTPWKSARTAYSLDPSDGTPAP